MIIYLPSQNRIPRGTYQNILPVTGAQPRAFSALVEPKNAFTPLPSSVQIHPTADVEPGARLGPHTMVWRFVHIMTGAQIGAHCSIGQGCFVASGAYVGDRCRIQNNVSLYDGVRLHDDVFVGPSVVFTNVKRPRVSYPTPTKNYDVTQVEEGVSIGANATILCGVRIGRGAMVGAGAVVTRDVPSHGLVVGCAARLRGGVCACGGNLVAKEDVSICEACGDCYRYENATGWEACPSP